MTARATHDGTVVSVTSASKREASEMRNDTNTVSTPPHPVEEAVARVKSLVVDLRDQRLHHMPLVSPKHYPDLAADLAALLSALERQKEALEAARHHIAARDALEDANILAMDVNDPRFAAVTDTLEHLRAALNKEPSHG